MYIAKKSFIYRDVKGTKGETVTIKDTQILALLLNKGILEEKTTKRKTDGKAS